MTAKKIITQQEFQIKVLGFGNGYEVIGDDNFKVKLTPSQIISVRKLMRYSFEDAGVYSIRITRLYNDAFFSIIKDKITDADVINDNFSKLFGISKMGKIKSLK